MKNEKENITDTSTIEPIRIVVNGVNYDAVPAKPNPWPQRGDSYEHITAYGFIVPDIFVNEGDDHRLLEMGNVYRPGTAQAVVDRQEAIVKVNDWIRENCEPPNGDCAAYYIQKDKQGNFSLKMYKDTRILSVILPLRHPIDLVDLMEVQGENIKLIMREVDR